MPIHDLSRSDPSAREILVEANGTPFAPCEKTRPVVSVLDGRRTNDDLEPEHWIEALEAADGDVAVYFGLAADHEWWLAYDADPDEGAYDDEYGLEGPYHSWTTYPSGPWDHTAQTRGIFQAALGDLYYQPDREEKCDIYRSKVVATRDAPEMIRRKVRGDDRV